MYIVEPAIPLEDLCQAASSPTFNTAGEGEGTRGRIPAETRSWDFTNSTTEVGGRGKAGRGTIRGLDRIKV